MAALRVACFGDDAAVVDAESLLSAAGFLLVYSTDEAHFLLEASSACCALVFAATVEEGWLPDPLSAVHMPPAVLVSPLPLERATRVLGRPGVIHSVLAPEAMPRVLVPNVADAAICEIFARTRYAIAHHPGIGRRRRLRDAVLRVLEKPVPSVQSMARLSGSKRNTLDKHWRCAFPDASTAEAFVRGVLLLRAIHVKVRDPYYDWKEIALELGITPDRLCIIARDLAGVPPTRLDLDAAPGSVIAAVCSLAIPTPLPLIARESPRV
jgi:hypothetical protein